MNEESVKSIIAIQRMNNRMLGLIDSAKNDSDISLKQLLNQFYTPYDKVEPNYSTQHIFLHHYQLISSLFTYIVLPKETFFNSIPNKIESSSLKNKWGINKLSPSYKLKYFIKRMRNAISHGNIEFTKKMEFTFTDVNTKDKNDTFQVKLSDKELLDFTQALGYWCITKDIELIQL